MSKVFNMVGGGGGKNISSIIITGLKSTDTITCTKDGKSYTATWDSTAQHWEIVGLPLGTFNLTATRKTETTTETVLIDIAGVYEIEMYLRLWLYRDGDECEDVTGGWTSNAQAYTSDTPALAPTLTKNTSNMSASITQTYGDYGGGTILPENKVSIDGYPKIYLSAVADGIDWTRLVLLSDKTGYWADGQKTFNLEGDYSDIEFDISDVPNGSYYIGFGVYSGAGTKSITISKLSLK